MNNDEIIANEIAELEKLPINYSNAEKLAYLYIVQDHLSKRETLYNSGSELSKAIRGKDIQDVLAVIDELMRTISVLSPKLYTATLERLKSL